MRSKYKQTGKKIDLKDNNLALTSQVDKNRNIHKNKSTFKKRHGFKEVVEYMTSVE